MAKFRQEPILYRKVWSARNVISASDQVSDCHSSQIANWLEPFNGLSESWESCLLKRYSGLPEFWPIRVWKLKIRSTAILSRNRIQQWRQSSKFCIFLNRLANRVIWVMVRKLVEFPKFWWSTLEWIPLGTVLMPLFPYCCHLSSELQFCWPRFQGKMDVTFGKCNCYSFALCLPYSKLASYSTRLTQVSNDAKLNLADATESKFRLLHCTEYQKTLYAAQQLRGAAGAWWASYIATLPDDHHVPWVEFCTAFLAHHLSAGLLCSKLKEFLDSEQGNRSVFDYMSHLVFKTKTRCSSYVCPGSSCHTYG
jgi:hypothetical protein